MTKTTRSRSLFEALDMICIQKYTSLSLQNWKIRCEEAKSIMSSVITSDYFIIIHTSRTKGYVHSQLAHGPLIAALFQSFEVSFRNISPFSNQIKPKIFETVSDATESNAQRNKLNLQATTSSGISHFRKTHLKRHEVVMRGFFQNCFIHFIIFEILKRKIKQEEDLVLLFEPFSIRKLKPQQSN